MVTDFLTWLINSILHLIFAFICKGIWNHWNAVLDSGQDGFVLYQGFALWITLSYLATYNLLLF